MNLRGFIRSMLFNKVASEMPNYERSGSDWPNAPPSNAHQRSWSSKMNAPARALFEYTMPYHAHVSCHITLTYAEMQRRVNICMYARMCEKMLQSFKLLQFISTRPSLHQQPSLCTLLSLLFLSFSFLLVPPVWLPVPFLAPNVLLSGCPFLSWFSCCLSCLFSFRFSSFCSYLLHLLQIPPQQHFMRMQPS